MLCGGQQAPSEGVYFDMLEVEHRFQVEEDGTRLVLENDTSKLVFEGARVACVGLGRWMDWLAWDGWVGWNGAGCHHWEWWGELRGGLRMPWLEKGAAVVLPGAVGVCLVSLLGAV